MTAYIAHPELPGRTVEVPEAAVPHYRGIGWETAPKPEPVPKLPATPAETAGEASAAEATAAAPDPDPDAPKRRRSTAKES